MKANLSAPCVEVLMENTRVNEFGDPLRLRRLKLELRSAFGFILSLLSIIGCWDISAFGALNTTRESIRLQLVQVTSGSVMEASSNVVMRVKDGGKTFVQVYNPIDGVRSSSFPVSARSNVPILLKYGILVSTTDGNLVIYDTGGTEVHRSKIQNASIVDCVRVSGTRAAAMAVIPNKVTKDLEMHLLTINFDGAAVSWKEIGILPASSGVLCAPSDCDVWWLRGGESKHFRICE